MKILVGLKGLFRLVGITEQDRSSWKYITVLSIQIGSISCTTASLIWYLLFEAGTFIDSTEAFYYVCAFLGVFTTFIDALTNQAEIFRLIALLESRMEERK